MQKLLVTGANGFVGHHLIHELREHDYDVLAICGRMPLDTELEALNGVTQLQIDLLDPQAVATINFSDIDGVIHLAGLAAVGPSFDDPARYISSNAGMQINLLEEALKQNRKPRTVVVSTGALYDPTADLPLTESSPAAPSSPYAVSKLAQENLAQYYTNRDIDCIIARPFNHIGPGQGLGFLIPDITQQIVAAEQGEQSTIKVGNLDAERDYTDVRDIARAYRMLYEKGQPGELYNVCSGTARSGKSIVTQLVSASTAHVEIEQDPERMRPADNPIIYGSHDKLSKATGWQPEISFEETLNDVLADWRSR